MLPLECFAYLVYLHSSSIISSGYLPLHSLFFMTHPVLVSMPRPCRFSSSCPAPRQICHSCLLPPTPPDRFPSHRLSNPIPGAIPHPELPIPTWTPCLAVSLPNRCRSPPSCSSLLVPRCSLPLLWHTSLQCRHEVLFFKNLVQSMGCEGKGTPDKKSSEF